MPTDPIKDLLAQATRTNTVLSTYEKVAALKVAQLDMAPWRQLVAELNSGGAMIIVPTGSLTDSYGDGPHKPSVLLDFLKRLEGAIDGHHLYRKLADCVTLHEQDEAYQAAAQFWKYAQQLKHLIRSCVIVKPLPDL